MEQKILVKDIIFNSKYICKFPTNFWEINPRSKQEEVILTRVYISTKETALVGIYPEFPEFNKYLNSPVLKACVTFSSKDSSLLRYLGQGWGRNQSEYTVDINYLIIKSRVVSMLEILKI